MVVADERGTEQRPAPSTRVPLRGTQSFVGVMVQVWKRPALIGLELLWRWIAGGALLWLAWRSGSRALHGVRLDTAALEAMTVFRPVEAAATIGGQMAQVLPPLVHLGRWLLPVAAVVWASASALGRTAILRRLDPTLRSRPMLLGGFGFARLAGFAGTLALWAWGAVAAGRLAVTGPARAGSEPNVVLYTALVVGLALLLFMVWSLASWVPDAAPLFAMAQNLSAGQSLRAVAGAASLRSKLIETNLVMGIVKLALLVLALVFSASPLPFSTVETQGYLEAWWVFVGVLYLVASDVFHVVHRASYLALFRALAPPSDDATRTTERAS